MDALLLSRVQFADTAAFHILWPLLSIGLALYMLVMEVLWLYTGKENFYHQVRFWTKIFILTFAVGTASGFPLSFQFGTNWAAFSAAAGDFFGNILGFESTVAFALEAAFLAIFVFGWGRVSKAAHLFANAMVFVGATLSAFWIMAANSWMQTPAGVTMENGRIVVQDYFAAVFNPSTMVSFMHMWVACIETTLFFMAGLCAAALLFSSREHTRYRGFFLDSFKYAIALALFFAPLQGVLGHMSGSVVAEHQPQKLAAIELHWDTNSQGAGAALSLLAIPDGEKEENKFAITVPDGLSWVITGSKDGEVQGLKDFPVEDRPTVTEATLAFYAFRTMVGIGIFFIVLALVGAYYWARGRLDLAFVHNHPLFLWVWLLSLPLGFVATIAGWMTREIGRQPFIVYNLIRTKDGLSSNLDPAAVATSLIAITVFYTAFLVLFIVFTYRIMKKGPDFHAPSHA